ncbi:MAG TPA: hypothetical protein PLU01_07820 [Nitrospira sp.]|uniref:hypothetical protein n=1 Tax=Nitrospira sp. ND1 TaxID=1658518 RepID=UPI0009C5C2D5|nr:hypothetical protein [Nitrospira sp. ND1]MBK7418901.1 hypothetical protein [Nitrospira sp.]MBK7485541.1 hypothetical protein [Nitrospira sp.]MBK8377444.1 hypothetical protein [Nitrospira sp.]MBK9111870.1 hypothetical protein [Nitrospira sp.]MBK9998931.1 hypothetical protein [Nitrospira sp.]
MIAQGCRMVGQCCVAVGLALLLGCAGTGEMVSLNLQTQQPFAQSSQTEPLKIVIEPFEDLRTDRSKIGQRTHLGGGVTNFNVNGGAPGVTIAEALAETLRQRGWNRRGWDARVVQAGVGVSGADIVIGGEIRDFSTNAKSRVFNTKLTGESRLVIKARNLADDSSTVRNIQGEQTKLVFWFTSEDVETLMSGLLQDGIERFITDTKIEGRTLKSAK